MSVRGWIALDLIGAAEYPRRGLANLSIADIAVILHAFELAIRW